MPVMPTGMAAMGTAPNAIAPVKSNAAAEAGGKPAAMPRVKALISPSAFSAPSPTWDRAAPVASTAALAWSSCDVST